MTSSYFNSQVFNHKKDELNNYKHSSVSLIFSFTLHTLQKVENLLEMYGVLPRLLVTE